jgi:sterol desaturase/sphingolipid hydroxylase (fatty acid hydroxylase superfamily)
MSRNNETITAFAAAAGFEGLVMAFAGAVTGFLLLYFGSAITVWFLTRTLLPSLRIGAIVDRRPLRHGQIGREIRRSLVSILIFGVYGLVTFVAWRSGIVRVEFHPSWYKLAGDVALLLGWNEVHFYCMHRLLHTPWLYRHAHRIHHESLIPTPFSTYSFHWLEAVLLGSVMILPMLFYPFSAAALLALPLMSIVLNAVGHCNYNVFANHPAIYSASLTHSAHHQRVAGNYGFYLPFLDRWAKTAFLRAAR